MVLTRDHHVYWNKLVIKGQIPYIPSDMTTFRHITEGMAIENTKYVYIDEWYNGD